jgi:hypothetical protein
MDQATHHAVEVADAGPSDLQARLLGLGGIVSGAALGWFLIWRPLAQARAGAPEISLSINGAFALVPILLVAGAMYLVGGARVKYRDTSVHPPRPLPMFWVMMVLMLAVGGALFWYTQAQLDALGYR